MQPNIPNLERSFLANIDAHELGGVLVEDIDVSEPIQQELLADRARHCREEGHGGCSGSGGAGSRATGRSCAYRRIGSVSIRVGVFDRLLRIPVVLAYRGTRLNPASRCLAGVVRTGVSAVGTQRWVNGES